MMESNLKNIIESLIFVSDTSVDMPTLRKVLPDIEARELRQAVMELIEDHEARQGGFILREVAGGWQFRTRPEYKEWVKRLVQPPPARLSKAALETLAIIAYHQPIIRSDIEHIRGVDSGAILRGLLERKLVRILGKKEIPGRPLIYGTTKRFLEVFNLRSLSDMPSLKEIESFGQAISDGEEGDLTDEAPNGTTDETTGETTAGASDAVTDGDAKESGDGTTADADAETNEEDGQDVDPEKMSGETESEDMASEAEDEEDAPDKPPVSLTGDTPKDDTMPQETDSSTTMADQMEEAYASAPGESGGNADDSVNIDEPDNASDEYADDSAESDVEKTSATDTNDA